MPEPGAETPMQPQPEQPLPEDPEQPSQPLPPPPQATCIPTHAGACMPAADFAATATALAGGYRSHRNFANQWGLSVVNADHAYAHVNQLEGATAAPGAGVTIGFVDSGIDGGHPDFAGKTVAEVMIGGATDETGEDRASHGTAVASVAAAIRTLNEHSAHGVAWGADIAMFAIPTGTGSGDYRPITVAQLAGSSDWWAGIFDRVFTWREGGRRVDILNLSVGHHGIIDDYSEQELRDHFGAAIAALAQAGAGDKTILVWAAGNAHGDSCRPGSTNHCVDNKVNAVSVEVLPGLAARASELRGHSIAVVALNKDGTIAEFSNRCGIAADNCIAAPGRGVRVAYFGPHDGAASRGHGDSSGTSFAAPFVAGGLAVMKQLFRDQLSNTELVARLFATANDDGTYADRAVYGQGAMDLRAATWPVGVLDVPVGGNGVDGPGATLAATRLRTGAAFGDGMERSLSGHEIAAFDTLGAPFWFDLGQFTSAARELAGWPVRLPIDTAYGRIPPTGDARRSMSAGRDYPLGPLPAAMAEPDGGAHWRVGLLETPGSAAVGHLALAERAPALTLTDQRILTGTAFTTGGGPRHAPVSGAVLVWRRAESPLGLRAGWMIEPESLLGSTSAGAFGSIGAETGFVGVEAETALGNWRLRAEAEFGTVGAVVRDGMIADLSPLVTSAAALHASVPVARDGTLAIRVAQPLRVERGRASLQVPAGRTRAGAVTRRAVAVDLAPSGRQIEVAAQLRHRLAIGEVRVGAMVTHHPGHRAGAAPEMRLLSGWSWAY